MTGRRHRSNCELVAQGVANIAAGDVRRHLRHRHHRAHRDQRPRRRARPGLGHAARALPAAVHAGGGAARRLHPARQPRRRARRRGLEHGGEGGVRARCCAPRAATPRCCWRRSCSPSSRDLTIAHRRRRHARRASCSCTAWPRRWRWRARRPLIERRTSPTRPAPPAPPTMPMRSTADVVVYRISGAFFFGATAAVSSRARPHRRAPEGVRARFLRRAAGRQHRRQGARRLRAQAAAVGHARVLRRRRGAKRAANAC